MKKSRLLLLSLLTTMSLTSCSLFNDDDIKIENKFNEKGTTTEAVTTNIKIGDVEALRVDDVPNTLVFKSIVYSNMAGNKIENTYKTLGSPYNVNLGNDYDVDPSNNNFDLYVPESVSKTDDINVVLFLHGGAWISGLKTQVNPYVKKFANEGYIAATIEYTLLNKDMNDTSLSIFRDLDEIDACISTLKSSLVGLGYSGTLNLVLGGASSGAHLAMLYAYSRYSTCDMPIKFLIDAVGPVDIKEADWKAFKVADQSELDTALAAGIEYSTIQARRDANKLNVLPVAGQGYNWNEYQTMRITNGMCGLPYSVDQIEATSAGKVSVDDHSCNEYKNLVSNTGSGQDLVSVTYHLKKLKDGGHKIPIICAYGGKDSVIGIAQYAKLQKAFIDNSYVEDTDYKFVYFQNQGHVNLDGDETHYNEFISKILTWMAD